ncbi:MAG: hypothetical protein R3E93_05505 [Thiothrix sp.]
MFSGHPDLRQSSPIMVLSATPFRKDFPLIGQVECATTPEQQSGGR